MAEDIKIKYINIGSENLPVKSAEKDKKVSEVINILAEKPLNIKVNEADDKDGQDLLYILNLLESLYAQNSDEGLEFRHSYSNIFNAMVRLIPPNEDRIFSSKNNKLENLSNNMQWLKEILDKKSGISIKITPENKVIIRKVCELQNNDKFNKGFFKLYDHILLEYARIAFSSSWIDRVEIAENRLNLTNKSLGELKEESNKLREKSQKMQKEYVAILGIFAAIITAFFSGIGFSSSVLTNMHQVTIYRLTFVVLLLGCVLFNILSLLMNFIRKMVELNPHVSNNILKWGNITFVVLLVLGYVAWRFQFFGNGSL